MQKKKGISLIVLVITIIVMVILAGAIVLTLNNSGIIDKSSEAVKQTNLATVKELTQMAWAEAYVNGARTEAELKAGVDAVMAKNKIDMSKYDIVVTTTGVTVSLNGGTGENDQQPEKPNTPQWVITTVDTVPIPKGFVASPYEGENTKNGGLVIYELKANETAIPSNETEYTSKTTRNQYVWVPVENFDNFKRQNFEQSEITISNTLGTNDWEVSLDTTTNMPLPTQSSIYMTSETLAEVQAMYESVKEYKGFYIARYEAGIDTQRKTQGNAADLPGIKEGTRVYSVMGKIPYTYIPLTWNNSMAEDTNGAVEVARRMYPKTNTNYGVVSTLTYGVQWDRTLAWWLEVGAKDGNGNKITSVTDSISYGNYVDHTIAAGDLNDGAKYAIYNDKYMSLGSYQNATSSLTKSSDTIWALSTGALKAASVNNISDMAGNVLEWTMEGKSASHRVGRGGSFGSSSDHSRVSWRHSGYVPNSIYANSGFRFTLYIKK